MFFISLFVNAGLTHSPNSLGVGQKVFINYLLWGQALAALFLWARKLCPYKTIK